MHTKLYWAAPAKSDSVHEEGEENTLLGNTKPPVDNLTQFSLQYLTKKANKQKMNDQRLATTAQRDFLPS